MTTHHDSSDAISRVLYPVAYLHGADDLPRGVFIRAIEREGLRYCVRETIEKLDRAALAELGESELEYSSEQPQKLKRLFRLEEDALALLIGADHGSGATLEVAADSPDYARRAAARLAELLRAAAPESDRRLEVSFWSQGRAAQFMGPRRRRLEVPDLAELTPNYAPQVSAALTRLGSLRPTDQFAGRLVLWHGPPGTGKTWALRGLAGAWREWCELHYVTDPELFLGADTAYMTEVLEGNEGLFDEPGDETERWRLIALEDAGELLTPDAARQTGQAFSRLLNAVDGLLGQGLRVILLITTNEPLGKLHPAITRPGRALAEIEFLPLGPEAAREWLAARGSQVQLDGPRTIAELYALLRGERLSGPSPSLGFG